MAPRKDKNGFTFITTIMMISILALTLPFLSYAIQTVQPASNYDELAMDEFYRFVRDEIIKSQSVYVIDDTLYLVQEEDDLATISLYYEVIRRQVNGQGHEIYLRDIAAVHFNEQPYSIEMIITDLKGRTYEKTFSIYNEK